MVMKFIRVEPIQPKMEDRNMREKFLESYNRVNSIK